MKKVICFALFVSVLSLCAAEVDINKYRSEKLAKKTENIVWNVSYSYNARDTKSPRVLLVGDSVCRGYHSLVRDMLASKVNISYWATSNCITDPFYLPALELMLAKERYDLIIINNGLHSLSTDLTAWRNSYMKVLDYLEKRVPETGVVVLNSTPKKDGDQNVDKINAITAEIAAQKKLSLADIHSLCKNWSKKNDPKGNQSINSNQIQATH